MAKKLYVGNLNYDTDQDALREIFSAHGTVESAEVIMDKYTGQSKGFGFVEMSTEEEARTAIQELDGKDIDGRAVKVNEARPRTEGGGGRSGGGGGGRRGGGGGGGGYGGGGGGYGGGRY